MSDKELQSGEEQFEVPPQKQPEQHNLTKEQQLVQQNTMLKNVLQGLVTMLDKVTRGQSQVSAQLGTISNSIEQILQGVQKQEEKL